VVIKVGILAVGQSISHAYDGLQHIHTPKEVRTSLTNPDRSNTDNCQVSFGCLPNDVPENSQMSALSHSQ
jgi:hypothetical protein